eukprot:TRINITY_DN1745_c0_g1_i1.p1 TRINITY_DN1745_c0_g1~~TRINITY_DN1745_c0_g1_i1.p1  ORF type:complete len:521 (+),score=59.93 TRINITY_DN1745_c0_g1_i1:108-1565(+)
MKFATVVWLELLVSVLGVKQRVLLDSAPEMEMDIGDGGVVLEDGEMMYAGEFGSIFDDETFDLAGPGSEDLGIFFDHGTARASEQSLEDSQEQERILDLATQIYGEISGSRSNKAIATIKKYVNAGEVEAVGIALASAATVDADRTASIVYQILRQELDIDDMVGPLIFSVEYGSTVASRLIADVLQKFSMEGSPYPGSELAFKLIDGNATVGREVFIGVQEIIDQAGCAGFGRLVSGALVLGEAANISTDVDNAIRQGSINNCIARFGPNIVAGSGLENVGLAEARTLAQTFLAEAKRYLQTGNSAPFVSPLDSAGLRYQVEELADIFQIAFERALRDQNDVYTLTLALPELSGFAGPGVQLGLTKAMNRIRKENGCEALGSFLTVLTSKASEQKVFFQWSLAMQQEEGLLDCIGQSVDTCIGFALRDCCFPDDGGEMPSRCSNCGFQLGCRFVQDRSSVKEIGYFVYKDQRFNEALCKCPLQV